MCAVRQARNGTVSLQSQAMRQAQHAPVSRQPLVLHGFGRSGTSPRRFHTRSERLQPTMTVPKRPTRSTNSQLLPERSRTFNRSGCLAAQNPARFRIPL